MHSNHHPAASSVRRHWQASHMGPKRTESELLMAASRRASGGRSSRGGSFDKRNNRVSAHASPAVDAFHHAPGAGARLAQRHADALKPLQARARARERAVTPGPAGVPGTGTTLRPRSTPAASYAPVAPHHPLTATWGAAQGSRGSGDGSHASDDRRSSLQRELWDPMPATRGSRFSGDNGLRPDVSVNAAVLAGVPTRFRRTRRLPVPSRTVKQGLARAASDPSVLLAPAGVPVDALLPRSRHAAQIEALASSPLLAPSTGSVSDMGGFRRRSSVQFADAFGPASSSAPSASSASSAAPAKTPVSRIGHPALSPPPPRPPTRDVSFLADTAKPSKRAHTTPVVGSLTPAAAVAAARARTRRRQSADSPNALEGSIRYTQLPRCTPAFVSAYQQLDCTPSRQSHTHAESDS